jgi:hypothetical protein
VLSISSNSRTRELKVNIFKVITCWKTSIENKASLRIKFMLEFPYYYMGLLTVAGLFFTSLKFIWKVTKGQEGCTVCVCVCTWCVCECAWCECVWYVSVHECAWCVNVHVCGVCCVSVHGECGCVVWVWVVCVWVWMCMVCVSVRMACISAWYECEWCECELCVSGVCVWCVCGVSVCLLVYYVFQMAMKCSMMIGI